MTIKTNTNGYEAEGIQEKRVSLTGYTCTREELFTFQSMTYRDDLYRGKLMQIAS